MTAINYQAALARLGDDVDIWREIASTFIELAREDSLAIRKNLSDANRKDALYHAHKLKGAALTVGAESLALICGMLEAGLRESEDKDFSTAVESIERETEAALNELTSRLKA